MRATNSIPVDLFNPGHVFACIGMLELADRLSAGRGGARGRFDWIESSATAHFTLDVPGDDTPFMTLFQFIARAELCSLAPAGSTNTTLKWDVPTHELADGWPFSMPDPPSPATLPARLVLGGDAVTIDHWGDQTIRDNVKFWAGAGGYPGVALLQDAIALMRDRLEDLEDDPLNFGATQSSSFRFDWRRDYVPLEIGLSLNNHTTMSPVGYPIVEIFSAIGLSHARPQRPSRRDKLTYRYAVNGGHFLRPSLVRAALGCAPLPFPTRTFTMHLGWPGQEGQARCITKTTEETSK